MILPDFSFEKKLWKKYKFVAGMDEVGRGSFAGPVVTACVIFPQISIKVLINDSKKLSSKQRKVSDIWIRENAIAFGIGEASVAQINKFGIKKATEIAFRKAISNINKARKVEYLLMDAFYVPYVKGLKRKNQLAIVKGDQKSLSIAAASIIAKVYRDKLMVNLSKNRSFKKYGWEKNKGYGTKGHRDAISKHGTTKHHRKQFIETWLSKIGS